MASGYDDDRNDRDDRQEPRQPVSTDRARRRVSLPALLIILNGILGLFFAAALFTVTVAAPDVLLDFFKQTIATQPPGPEKQENEKKIQDLEDKLKQDPAGNAVTAGIQLGIFSILNLVAIFGATKMKGVKSYGWSLAATIITTIPCITGCCCTGPLIGIWGLIVLLSEDVKAGFAAVAKARQSPDGY